MMSFNLSKICFIVVGLMLIPLCSLSGQIGKTLPIKLYKESVNRFHQNNFEYKVYIEYPNWFIPSSNHYIVYQSTEIPVSSKLKFDRRNKVIEARISIPEMLMSDSLSLEFLQTKRILNPKILDINTIQQLNSNLACSNPSSTTIKIDWIGGHCNLCDPGTRNYSCNVNPNYFTDWNNGNKNFMDPLPPNSIVMMVEVEINGALNCGNGNMTATINGTSIGTTPNTGNCSCNNCSTTSVTGNFSGGLAGYNYGGNNQLNLSSTGVICVDFANVTIYYCDACSADCVDFPYSPQ